MSSHPNALNVKLTKEKGGIQKANHTKACRHRIYQRMWEQKEPKLMRALSTQQGRERLKWDPPNGEPGSAEARAAEDPAGSDASSDSSNSSSDSDSEEEPQKETGITERDQDQKELSQQFPPRWTYCSPWECRATKPSEMPIECAQ